MINQLQRILVLCTIALVVCSSCQFNQSVHKDLNTGAFIRGNGLSCDDVFTEINGEPENRNEFIYGETVNIVFGNVLGMKVIDQKSYPQMSMYIVKNETDTVLSNPSMLKNIDKGTDLQPLQLSARFRPALPYSNNEQYKVYVEIWDTQGEGTFSYSLPFTVRENDLLAIESKGLKYSNIYLWNEGKKKPLFDRQVSSEDLYVLILDDIEGLEPVEGKVFPILSIDLEDSKGNKILSNPNLLRQYEYDGVAPEVLKKQLIARIEFAKGEVNNPLKLRAAVKDKHSSNEILISTDLTIVKEAEKKSQ